MICTSEIHKGYFVVEKLVSNVRCYFSSMEYKKLCLFKNRVHNCLYHIIFILKDKNSYYYYPVFSSIIRIEFRQTLSSYLCTIKNKIKDLFIQIAIEYYLSNICAVRVGIKIERFLTKK